MSRWSSSGTVHPGACAAAPSNSRGDFMVLWEGIPPPWGEHWDKAGEKEVAELLYLEKESGRAGE